MNYKLPHPAIAVLLLIAASAAACDQGARLHEELSPGLTNTWTMTVILSTGDPMKFGGYRSRDACEAEISQVEVQQYARDGRCEKGSIARQDVPAPKILTLDSDTLWQLQFTNREYYARLKQVIDAGESVCWTLAPPSELTAFGVQDFSCERSLTPKNPTVMHFRLGVTNYVYHGPSEMVRNGPPAA